MLLGRAAELDRALALLDRPEGSPAALLVRGTAGVGKTSLLAAVADVARERDVEVAACAAVPAERDWPYAGVDALVRRLDHAGAALLDEQRDALAAVTSAAPDGVPRQAVAGALLALLAAAASRGPLLLVVDDVQWLDDATVDCLGFVLRRLGHDRVGVLLAERVTDGAGSPPRLASVPVLDLGPLTDPDAVALARSAGAAAGVAETVAAHCGGLPLALVEVVAALGPGARAGAEPLPSPLPPSTPEHGYLDRIVALGPEARTAAAVAAVCEGPAAAGLPAALAASGLAPGSLDDLEAAAVLTLGPAGPLWCHPLARSAALRAVPAARLRAVRSAVADAVEALGGPSDAVTRLRADAAAAPSEPLAVALDVVAERAESARAHRSAAMSWEAAARIGTDARRVAVRLSRAARSRIAAGDVEVGSALADRALQGLEDDIERWWLLLDHGVVAATGGSPTAAVDRYRDAAAAAERAGDRQRVVRALAATVNPTMHFGGPDGVEAAAERVRTAHDPSDPYQAFLANAVHGFAALNAERPSEGLPALEAAVRLLEDGRLLADAPELLETAVQALMWSGNPLRHRDAVMLALETRRRAGDLAAVGEVLRGLAWCDYSAGSTASAQVLAQEALDLARDAGRPTQLVDALTAVAVVEGIRGNPAVAVACAREARAVAGATDSWYRVADALWAETFAHLCVADAGAAAEAGALLGDLLVGDRLAVTQPEHLDAAVALAGAGRHDEARAVRDAMAKRLGDAPRHDSRAALALADVWIAGAAGAPPPDVSGVVADLDGEADLLWRGRLRLAAGAALRRSGDRTRARALLREAIDDLTLAGATAWVAQARDEQRASGVKVRSAWTEPLTGAELRVARAVAAGRTNREVAATLFLSVKTVEFHLGRIFRKLDVRSRAELVRAVLSGALDDAGPGQGV
ncbi:MAG: AAA family ATPase [Actinobacteria bacterium]|nr:AAA family ATPase [Actinomycetota bacterium]